MELKDKWNQLYKDTRMNTKDEKTFKLLEWIQNKIAKESPDPPEETSKERKWDLEREMPPWTRKDEPEPMSAVIVNGIIIAAVNKYTLSF